MKTIYGFFHLARPFWGSKKEWFAWVLLLSVLGFALGIIQVSVYINQWNKSFYDALANYDTEAMVPLIINYFGFILLVVLFIILGNWIKKYLMFRWRLHLTTQFQEEWLSSKKLYRLQLNDELDNPDQRIAEDVYLFCEKTIDLLKYFIMNVAKLVAFIGILWQISGVQHFTIGNYEFIIHGYLVWIAFVYTLVCTLITHFIGRKLHPLNIQRQHREADYRANLLYTREYAEQISLYDGEEVEKERMNKFFYSIKENWHDLIYRELKLESFSALYMRVAFFIPIFATLPLYLATTISFGDMMQARSAFVNVQDGFGWFMDYYKKIIEWAAVVTRLDTFQKSLEDLPNNKTKVYKESSSYVRLENLSVENNQGTTLLKPINLSMKKGEWFLFDGESGIGKTTLFRVLAGLWSFYQGKYEFSVKPLFLPQQPYLTQGSIRYLLSYPTLNNYSEQEMKNCLSQVGLSHLIEFLDSAKNWNKSLSGGEKQKLSIARALLQKPKILCMDEPTSQLDSTNAIILMQLLKESLPDMICLIITHQSEIKKLLNNHIVKVEKYI